MEPGNWLLLIHRGVFRMTLKEICETMAKNCRGVRPPFSGIV